MLGCAACYPQCSGAKSGFSGRTAPHRPSIRNWAPTADDQLSKAAWDPTTNWADQITSTIVNAFDDVHRHQSPPSSTASKMIEGTGKSTAITGDRVLKSVMK
jgi:hypothetical protein